MCRDQPPHSVGKPYTNSPPSSIWLLFSYVDVHAGEGEGGEECGVRDVDQALPREGERRSLGQVLRGGQAQAAEMQGRDSQ